MEPQILQLLAWAFVAGWCAGCLACISIVGLARRPAALAPVANGDRAGRRQ